MMKRCYIFILDLGLFFSEIRKDVRSLIVEIQKETLNVKGIDDLIKEKWTLNVIFKKIMSNLCNINQ